MRLFPLFLFANALCPAYNLAQNFQCIEPLPGVVMYPGDTNNDGVCNQYDLLPIGIAYGRVGPMRPNASINWVAQPGPAWNECLPVSQINLAFVDCNGQDTVNALDVAAILLNYDKTQPPDTLAFPPPMPYPPLLNQFCNTCAAPTISVTFDKDSLLAPDSVLFAFVRLVYNPTVDTSRGALGIAFNVDYVYTDLIVDDSTEVIPDDSPDSRMHVIAQKTGIVSTNLLPGAGRIEFAAAGRGKNVFFETNTLFTIKFIITDMIVRSGDTDTLSLRISDVLLLNNREELVGHNISTQSVIVKAAEPFSHLPRVFLSPNPVRATLSFHSPESPMEKIEIHHLAGGRVLSADVGGQSRFEMPVGSLPPGLWLAVVRTREGVAVKKFVKQE